MMSLRCRIDYHRWGTWSIPWSKIIITYNQWDFERKDGVTTYTVYRTQRCADCHVDRQIVVDKGLTKLSLDYDNPYPMWGELDPLRRSPIDNINQLISKWK